MSTRVRRLIRATIAVAPLLLAGCVAVPDSGTVYYSSGAYPVQQHPVYASPLPYASIQYTRTPAPIYYVNRPAPVVVVRTPPPIVVAPAHSARPPAYRGRDGNGPRHVQPGPSASPAPVQDGWRRDRGAATPPAGRAHGSPGEREARGRPEGRMPAGG